MNAKEGSKVSGTHAEGVAARYLKSKGVKIIERNVYSRGGEIDLIGIHNEVLVFFEVRYRGRSSFSTGTESIGYHKQQRIIKAASYYLHSHSLWNYPSRIDVVALAPGITKQYRIQWIQDAIQA